MEFLKTLKLQIENEGTSTGIEFLKSKGDIIKSYSPVDGNFIGNVNATDKEAYDIVRGSAECSACI